MDIGLFKKTRDEYYFVWISGEQRAVPVLNYSLRSAILAHKVQKGQIGQNGRPNTSGEAAQSLVVHQEAKPSERAVISVLADNKNCPFCPFCSPLTAHPLARLP